MATSIQEAGIQAVRSLSMPTAIGAGLISAIIAALVDTAIEMYHESERTNE